MTKKNPGIYDYVKEGSEYPVRVELYTKDAKKFAVILAHGSYTVLFTSNNREEAQKVLVRFLVLNPGGVLLSLYEKLK